MATPQNGVTANNESMVYFEINISLSPLSVYFYSDLVRKQYLRSSMKRGCSKKFFK
jgi:hypothetical protein